MQVVYIDVYFLINFTVDLIALFISLKLLHIKTTLVRLMLVALLGALSAVADALAGGKAWITVASAVIFLGLTVILIGKGITAVRRIRLLIVFLCIEMLLGGVVGYLYRILDKYAADAEEYFANANVNRKALIFAVIILLAIGVLKLFVMIFSGERNLKSVSVKIKVGKESIECDALVDSGNLVRDPMNMNPVIFVKSAVAGRLLPKEVIDLSGIDGLDYAVCKRIRLIPVTRGDTTHVLTGFLADEVLIGERGEGICATLAIDKEEGTYGGRDVLIPSSVLNI